jgi:hypothetical protein
LLQLVQTARQECSADSLHAMQARIRELLPPERMTAPDARSQQMTAEIFREQGGWATCTRATSHSGVNVSAELLLIAIG